MITEITKQEPKSDPEVMMILLDALHEARESKVISVTVTMTTDEQTYSTFAITPQSTYCEVLGNIELLKEKVMTKWKAK